MPWHDIHCRLIGPAVSDIAQHFVERWNFTCFGSGSGITRIRQNSSVYKERNASIENEEQKYGFFGFFKKNINQVNQKDNEEENLIESKNEKLLPEDNEKNDIIEEVHNDNNNNIINNNTKKKKNIFKKIREKYKEKEQKKDNENEKS